MQQTTFLFRLSGLLLISFQLSMITAISVSDSNLCVVGDGFVRLVVWFGQRTGVRDRDDGVVFHEAVQ